MTGTGKAGGYTPGTTFEFTVDCPGVLQQSVDLADGQSYVPTTPIPVARTCTITEGAKPPTPPAYGWDPVTFTVDGQPAGSGNSVTFSIVDAPVQVVATNPITPRTSSLRVTKSVSGQTAGFVAGTTFAVTLSCGPGLVHQLDVPVGAAGVTQADIPVGSSCSVSESLPDHGLVDASYAWGVPTFTPASTVTVVLGSTATVAIDNPIVRVTQPLTLVKSFSGAQGVVDPARTYPVTWSCTYRGAQVAGGTVNITADPSGVEVAAAVPLTSECTATEGDSGHRRRTPRSGGSRRSSPERR